MAISFGDNAKAPFAKVWKIDPQANCVKAQISTSEKDKDGKYVNSSWFATFVGKCVPKARELERGDSIKITAGKLSITKKDDKSYTNMVIFGFDEPDFESENTSAPKKESKKKVPAQSDNLYTISEDDEDLPF